MESKVWQRAAADLNPPGVPNSFRHAKKQQNIASVLLRREFGGARRQKTVRAVGEVREENFWAESESASKVRTFAVEGETNGTCSQDEDLRLKFYFILCVGDDGHSMRVGTLSCHRRPSPRSPLLSVRTGVCVLGRGI